MATPRLIPELLKRNEGYANVHRPAPFLAEMLKSPKRPRTLIFCCLDSRVRPDAFLSISPEEAILVRNAGGNVPANIKDVLILDQLLGLEEILVIEHTDCGGQHITEEELKGELVKYAPDHQDEIATLHFGAFKDVEGRARDFVNFVKNHPLVRKELALNTIGAVYDITTGKVTPIDA